MSDNVSKRWLRGALSVISSISSVSTITSKCPLWSSLYTPKQHLGFCLWHLPGKKTVACGKVPSFTRWAKPRQVSYLIPHSSDGTLILTSQRLCRSNEKNIWEIYQVLVFGFLSFAFRHLIQAFISSQFKDAFASQLLSLPLTSASTCNLLDMQVPERSSKAQAVLL